MIGIFRADLRKISRHPAGSPLSACPKHAEKKELYAAPCGELVALANKRLAPNLDYSLPSKAVACKLADAQGAE